jgi:putative ABC transport system permease protein
MDTLIQDVRYALRRLRKSPGFATVVILTLALGIGANSAIFSVINTVILRPLPYKDPEQLATVFHYYPNLNDLEAPVSAPGFRDYRDRSGLFTSAAVETGWAPTLTELGDPERLNGTRVSGDWFTTLGVPTLIGRPLRRDEDEPGREKVVVLSYGLWSRLYGGDSSVVRGRKMILNGEAFEIVGVMPRDFRDFWNRNAEIWSPLALPESNFSDSRRTSEFLNFIGRMKPGMTADAAAPVLTNFADQLKRDFPNNYGLTWTLKPRSLNEQATGRVRTMLFVLLGAVGFVLLIACANVANLMMVRAASRQKEIVIRTALGAQRGQLIRQLLAESVVLALIGGMVGLAFAYVGVRSLVAISPASLPRSDEIGIDPVVVAFTFGVSLVTGLLFGLVPAFQAARSNLQEVLKESGRGTSAGRASNNVRMTLVVTQMALALALLTGAGLLIRSFARLSDVETGFRPDNLLTFNLAPPPARYQSDTALRAYFDQVLPRIAAVPGVRAVATTSVAPFSGGWTTGSFRVEGYQPPPNQPGPWGDIRAVSNGFFDAIGAKLLKGRTFDATDIAGGVRTAIVDEEFVKRFWPGDDPVGKRITFNNLTDTNITWINIVGVVAHTKHESLDAPSRIQVYFPYSQSSGRQATVIVRTSGDPVAMTAPVRAAVQETDKDIPLARVQTMEAMINNSTAQRRLYTVFLFAFSVVAMVLASVGIYGVMSYSVSQRSQELGIRMALGAARNKVLSLVLWQGMALAILGVAIGLLGALFLSNTMQSMLYEIDPRDPPTFGTVAVLLTVVALVATLIPALRATRVDPVTALRNE